MRALALGLLLAVTAVAQEGAPVAADYRLKVTYNRAGLPIPHWQITLPGRGMGEYVGPPEKGPDPGPIVFRMSAPGKAYLGEMMQRSKGLQPCETKSKGIAHMGDKVFEYTPQDGTVQRCAFNFTDNKPLSQALEYVYAMTSTLQAGMELERLHRYDRLGLDPVMIRLMADANDGHAVEFGVIRPTLESLLMDVQVLDRVRLRAQQLLDMAKQEDAGKIRAAR